MNLYYMRVTMLASCEATNGIILNGASNDEPFVFLYLHLFTSFGFSHFLKTIQLLLVNNKTISWFIIKYED